VRAAEPRDAARISEIYNQGIEDGQATFETQPRTSADIHAKLNAPGNHVIVAEWGGSAESQPTGRSILGWASISPYSPRPCYAGIGEASVYISRSARHHGIGRLLLNALLDTGRRQGYHKLIGRLLVSNRASRQLVRNAGFREVGIMEKHGRVHGAWHDIVLVERLIEENL